MTEAIVAEGICRQPAQLVLTSPVSLSPNRVGTSSCDAVRAVLLIRRGHTLGDGSRTRLTEAVWIAVSRSEKVREKALSVIEKEGNADRCFWAVRFEKSG